MRHYQIFPFDAQGHLSEAVAVDLDSDVRAIRRALDTDFPYGCELWEGFRFVGRFHAPAAARAASAPDPLAEVEPPESPRKPALLH